MFEDILDLGTTLGAVQLGGRDKKTGKAYPASAQGHYLGSRNIPSRFSKTGFSKLHVLQTPEGSLGVFGKTDLDPKMAVVEPGTLVKITFSGTVPTNKGNPMAKFRVQVDKGDVIDVSGLANAKGEENSTDEDTSYYASEETEETDLGEEDQMPDEVVPARAQSPRQTAKAPTPEQIAKVQALLKGRGVSKSA